MIQVVFITNLRIILRYRQIPLVINRFMCFSLPIMDKNHNMFNFVVINHLCLFPGFQVYSCDAIVSKAAQVGKVSTTVVEDLTIAHSVQLQVDAKQYQIQIIVFVLFTRVLTPQHSPSWLCISADSLTLAVFLQTPSGCLLLCYDVRSFGDTASAKVSASAVSECL